ncbi:MAG: PAS domain-containing protein, partial [Candidatus Thorarchaeota archaeon]
MREEKPKNGRDSEERYKGIIRMANDGIVVIQDNKIAMVNPAFARILGYQQGELIGREFETLLDPVTAHVYKEEYEKFDLDVTQKLAYRIRMLTKTGKTLIMEMSTADFAYEGCPAVVGIVRDMTEHLKLEAAIEQSETKYRQLYQSSPIAYFTLSPRGIVLQVNKAAMELLGYTEEAMIRRSIESFLPNDPEAFKAGRVIVSGLLDGGSVTGIEMQMRKVDGKPIWVRVTAGPLERGEGARRI